MKRMKVSGIVVILILAVLSGCSGGSSRGPLAVAPRLSGPLLPSLAGPPAETEPAVALGRYAPDFTLTALDGSEMSLSDWRGKTVLLNFWASWCAPCREEMPLLQATYEAYGDNDLVVLAVNMGEDAKRVQGFTEDLAFTFPTFVDEGTSVGAVYRVRGAPTTYFIDRDGVIRQRYVGPLSSGMLGAILSGSSAYPNQ